ncbi:MAG TPA: S1 RNA-binding domain-containing protein, partial [Gemmatimonadaceae bacterium]
QMVAAITAEPEVGAVYEGTVKSTTAFGAFVEIMPGTEALLHISEMRHGRTEKTEDVVKKGDRVTVKLIDRDERGRLRLSMKALQPKPEVQGEEGGKGDEGGTATEGGSSTASDGSGEREERGGRDNGGHRDRPRGGRPRRAGGRGGRGERE